MTTQSEQKYDFTNVLRFDVPPSDFTIEEMGTHLLALKNLSTRIPPVLNNLLKGTGVRVDISTIRMGKIRQGSLIEEVIPTLVVFAAPYLAPKVAEFIQGNELIPKLLKIFTSCFANKAKDESAQQISTFEHKIINENCAQPMSINIRENHAPIIIINPDKFEKTVKGQLDRKVEAGIKDALDIIRPAIKRKASLQFGLDANAPIISSIEMQKYPEEYERKQPETKDKTHQCVLLRFRATDADKATSGWAADIPNIVEKRLPMALSPLIKPITLMGRTAIYADVTVTSKLNKKKNTYTESSIYVTKIYPKKKIV